MYNRCLSSNVTEIFKKSKKRDNERNGRLYDRFYIKNITPIEIVITINIDYRYY